MVGASHGAGVLLETATTMPDRISAAALVVPAGFGTSISLALARVVVPSLIYRHVPRRGLLERALAHMFAEPIASIDECVVETIGLALRTGDLAAEFPGPDDPSALAEFQAPTLLVTGEGDPLFPGERTCERAADPLPSLEDCVVLEDERHFLSERGQASATAEIRSFLASAIEER